MRPTPFVKTTKHFYFVSFLLLFGFIAQAQLKIGDNPTNIQKSSILELESTRQGLLLPRLSDTMAINALNPPNGMIIYLSVDNSLRLRSDGYWKRIASLADATANWALKGNSATDSATNFIGTLDGKPLTLVTNNAARMIVGSNGNVGIGTTTPAAKLNVNGSVKLDNLGAGTTELDVLVLNPNGSVLKRTLSSSAFENAIKAINGIQKQALTITAAASTTKDVVEVENRTVDSTIAIYLPVQDGASGASKPYGFLQYSDWQKIGSAIQTIAIGTVAASPDAKGASVSSTGTTRTITLHPANATNPGIVTAGVQTFGGDKTFQDDVTAAATLRAGSAGTANSTVQVDGSLSMAIKTVTANYTVTAADNTVLANTTSGAIIVTLPAPASFAGRIYTIKKIGTGGIDNDLTITPASGTIDGGTTYKIYNDWTYVTLQTDGTNWYIIKK